MYGLQLLETISVFMCEHTTCQLLELENVSPWTHRISTDVSDENKRGLEYTFKCFCSGKH
jgi:hypothetical protein